MKVTRIICALCSSALVAFAAKAQNIEDFTYWGYDYVGEQYLGVAASYSRLQNNAAPFPETHDQTGWTFHVDYKQMNFAQGKLRYTLDYKLLGDMIMLVDAGIDDTRALLREKESTISNGLLGWHQFIFNLNAPSRQSFGVGFHLNDYFLASTITDKGVPDGRVSLEPQGYYWTAGPALSYVLRPVSFLLVETSAWYSIPYWRSHSLSYADKDQQYPKPHFGHVSVELMTSLGFFAGLDYTFIRNRGSIPNRTQRLDALVGFRFML